MRSDRRLDLSTLKRLVRELGHRLGVDIRKHVKDDVEVRKLRHLAHVVGFDLVLDVGANVGQFAGRLRASGYNGLIVSFEPLSDAHKELRTQAAGDPAWIVVPPTAVGDRDGEIEINVAANSVSSSVLPILAAHTIAASASRYIRKERVNIGRLDTIALQYVDGHDSIFLKIDTQGYEGLVLDGATGLLDRIAAIQVELSLVPLYEGQPLFGEIFDVLRAEGFELIDLLPGFCDRDTGCLLQIDGFFVRSERFG